MTFKSPRQLTNRLETAYLPTSDLRPMPGAPREHPKSQIRALSKSFQAFGQVLPILIDRENRIVSGHAQWETAHRLQMEEVMVVRVDHLSEVQCKALMVALNRLGDLSKWNDLALGTILLDLQTADLAFDIEATGFTEIEIELRVEGLEAPAPEDEAPILVGEGPSVIQPGDLWLLGAHRLLCGDALNSDTWSQLMAGERAALVVTDPPFNVPIDGHVSGGGRHRHREFAQASGEMSAEAFTAFLQEAMTLACQWSADGALGYWAMDWRHVVEIGTAGLAAYDRFINMAVWAKNQPGMGSFYRSQHELFFVFAKGGAPYRNNVQLGRFGRSRSNVWSYPSAASLARTAEEGNPLAMHPTVKPLALISDILLDASVRGDLVADPFAGSGPTLIAAEKLGRRARVLEIDSAYCDAILTRWQKWTGETARRARDGVAFADAAAVVCGRAGDVPTLR